MKNAVNSITAYILAAVAGISFVSGLSILVGGERYV
jgi:hypothetical protein